MILAAGLRAIGEWVNASKDTIARHLDKFVKAGLITLSRIDDGSTRIDLRPMLDLVGEGLPSETPSHTGAFVQSVSLSNPPDVGTEVLVEHLSDDAFVTAHYTHVARRIAAGLGAESSFSATILFVVATIERHGEVSRADLERALGLTKWSPRAALRKLREAGLLVEWEGWRYSLHPDWEANLDELRPEMRSAGVGQTRAYRNTSARAAYLQTKLQTRKPMEAGKRARFVELRDKYDRRAEAVLAGLVAMGIDPRRRLAKVDPHGVPDVPKPTLLKIDHAEEWRTLYAPLWEQWRALAYAGYDQGELKTMFNRMPTALHPGGRQLWASAMPQDGRSKAIYTGLDRLIAAQAAPSERCKNLIMTGLGSG